MTHVELHETIPDDSQIASSDGADRRPRKRAKRVTAEHTLERVRNNQRKHRARRREYTSSLEDKLAEAEAALAWARGEIEQLQDELVRCRQHGHDAHVSPSGKAYSGLHQREENTATRRDGHRDGHGDVSWNSSITPVIRPFDLLPSEHLLLPPASVVPDENNLVPDNVAPVSPVLPNRSDHALRRGRDALRETANISCCSKGVSSAAAPIQSCRSTMTGPTDLKTGTETLDTGQGTDGCALGAHCCSDDVPTGGPQPGVLAAGEQSSSSSDAWLSPVLPSGVIQPAALEALFLRHDDAESTTSCTEAYSLISQQNFKGVSRRTIELWLWEGFRQARQPGDGCRVRNALLFSLLAFISDGDTLVWHD